MKLKQIAYICSMAGALLLAALTPVSADQLKSPAEILRQARQLEASSNLSDSKGIYKALIETYPKSKEAATAQQRLAAIKKAEEQKDADERRARQQREREEQEASERRQAKACDHLYVGKKVRTPKIFVGSGWAAFNYDAIVLGTGNGKVTVKITESTYYGETIELNCNSF